MYRPGASSTRSARPTAIRVGRFVSTSVPVMSRSSSASVASGSLKPSGPKILIPLSWYGLCDALITMPASHRIDDVMNAIPGVGSGPVAQVSAPIDVMPVASAVSNM
jgi:hypothetical protein